MLLVIEKDKAKELLDGYYNRLAKTGYVKQPTVDRFMVWLFLLDFTERVYVSLTDEDYNLINNLLICLFSNGDCLLPYETTRANISFGDNGLYIGSFNLRATESSLLRNANDNLRTTEVEQ